MDTPEIPSAFETRHSFRTAGRDHILTATGILLWLWGGLSIVALIDNQPDLFSRLGSIGVLYAGLHFGVYRSLVADTEKMVTELENTARLVSVWAACVKLHIDKPDDALHLLYGFDDLVSKEGQVLVSVKKRENHKSEILVFSLSTLQWGFGDAIFRAFKNMVSA